MKVFYIRFIGFVLLLFAATECFSQNAQKLFTEARELRQDGKDRKAVKKFEEALEAAKKENNLQIQMNAHVELAELQDNVVHYKEALNHYKEFSNLYKKVAAQKNQQLTEKAKLLTDSVAGLHNEVEASNTEIERKNVDLKKKESAIDSLTTKQLQSQLAIKDLELARTAKDLELKESEYRWNRLLFILIVIALLGAFIIRGYMVKRKGLSKLKLLHKQIVNEKQKSDDLLLNILPGTIAEELKESGETIPSRFEEATVMFTDFEGFTNFSERHSPIELVHSVDRYFKAFDQIMKKHQIEKIKTIGDAYMCVSGIPVPYEEHAANMIRAAIECREFVNQEAMERQKLNLPFLHMRIGIHTGPLVAGVVGSHKFSYDVWGDTVNIAARMEQSGATNQINVSEKVYQLAKEVFEFEYRGEIEAKNKGRMAMYFVKKEK